MRLTFATIILLYSVLSFGQSFEGTLKYKCNLEVSDKMKKMGLTKEMLLNKMKKEGSWTDTVIISYRQGDYYTLINRNPKTWSIYKAQTNKIYTMQDSSDICTVTDASIDLEFTMTGKMPTIQKLDTIVIIDGTTCNVVRVKWNSGIYDYYYSVNHLTIDSSLFSEHIYDGWADFLKISNSLPLKIIKVTGGMMTVTMTLVSTKDEVINEKLFSIPALVADKDLNIVKIANREVMRIKK